MQNSSDPPDFHCSYDGNRIAVEHTRLFRRSRGRLLPLHSLKIERRICKRLSSLLKAAHDPARPIHASVTFASCETVRGDRQESAVAKGLSDFIQRRLSVDPSLPVFLYMDDLSAISPSLSDVLLTEGAGASTAARHTLGQVDEWALAELDAAAKEKARRLPTYKARFDQSWLLFEVGGDHLSQWIEPSEEACSKGIVTEFDRVFVVDTAMPHVYEIRTRRDADV